MDYQNMSNEELERYVANKDGAAICEMAGRCLAGSKGMQQNYTRAYQLYHKGEKMGLKEAYLGLAQMYEHGIGLIRNQRLADEYRRLAGEDVTSGSFSPLQKGQEMGQAEPYTGGQSFAQSMKSSVPQEIVTVKRLAEDLNQIEKMKEEKRYSEARQQLQQFFDLLLEIQNGRRSLETGVDVELWKVNAYWILGHIGYLESDYQNAEHAFRQPGVLEMYPWAAYLIAIMHKVQGHSGSELESDLALLQAAQANTQLNDKELGDVLGMIGDLYLSGIGVQDKDRLIMAYNYYSQAKDLGNYYAEIQVEKFSSMPSGEIQYTE